MLRAAVVQHGAKSCCAKVTGRVCFRAKISPRAASRHGGDGKLKHTLPLTFGRCSECDAGSPNRLFFLPMAERRVDNVPPTAGKIRIWESRSLNSKTITPGKA